MLARLSLIFIISRIHVCHGFIWSSRVSLFHDAAVFMGRRSNTKYPPAVRFYIKETNLSSSRRDFNGDALRTLMASSLSFAILQKPPTVNADTDTVINEINDSTVGDPIIFAQSRSVTLIFESDDSKVFVDGSVLGRSLNSSPSSSMSIQALYQVPTKWTNPPDYLDTFSNGPNPLKACERIIVYQAPLGEDPLILEKSASIGVAKALGWLKKDGLVELGLLPASVKRADIISGKKLYKNIEEKAVDISEPNSLSEKSPKKQQYFEYDIAVAPSTCSESENENLRLGFCPYESIILTSSTIINSNMFVLAVLCTKDEWKRASGDIKRVRSSFNVNI